jgi:hypothetical protein
LLGAYDALVAPDDDLRRTRMGDFSAVTGSSQGSSHSEAQCAPSEIPPHPLMVERSLPEMARKIRLPWRSHGRLLTGLPGDVTLGVPGRDGQVREAESLQPDVVLAYKTDLVQPGTP